MSGFTTLIAVLSISTAPASPLDRAPAAIVRSSASVQRALPPLTPSLPSPFERKAQSVNTQNSHPVTTGALIGGAIGVVIGKVAMGSAINNCPVGRSCSTAGLAVAEGLILGAAGGALLGWVLGR